MSPCSVVISEGRIISKYMFNDMRKEQENPGYDSRDRNLDMSDNDSKAEHSQRDKSLSDDTYSEIDLNTDLDSEEV